MELTGKKILIIVENLPVPFDRRVWHEANTLKNNGADVYIISPKAHAKDKSEEIINGIEIFRHPLLIEGNSAISFEVEYGLNLILEFYLAVKIFLRHKFNVIHACNPPDLIFLVALPFKLLGVKFLFDHHDITLTAWKTDLIKTGFNWATGEKDDDGTVTAKITIFDAWLNVNLDSVIGMPILILGRYATGEDTEAKVETTYMGAGIGYQFNRSVRMALYYEEYASDDYNEDTQTNFYVKAEAKY